MNGKDSMKKGRLVIGLMLTMTCVARPVFAEEVSKSPVHAEKTPMTPVMVSFLTPVQLPSQSWDVNGFRLNLLYGRCQDMTGLDVGLVNHTVGSELGMGIGLVNYVEENFTGLQIGLVNTAFRASAIQIGFYNGADDMTGIQIGVINHTRLMRGLQIGLVNVIENNDLTVLPVVNFFF